MKKLKIFLDTNILISGIFFRGLESILLKTPDVSFITSDVNYQEVLDIVKRKFEKLHVNVLKIALEEVDKAFEDIQIIPKSEWQTKVKEASKFLVGTDQKILAAVLLIKPNYFVTGDKNFYKPKIRKLIKIVKTREILKNFGMLK